MQFLKSGGISLVILLFANSVYTLPAVLPSNLDKPRNGMIGDQYKWPMGKVPVNIDPIFSTEEIAEIRAAYAEIENATCIRFTPKDDNSTNWLELKRNDSQDGCTNQIGRQSGGAQDFILGVNCRFKGQIIHETVHTLGLYHEQSRIDRDDFVRINFTNIPPESHYLFDKFGEDLADTFGLPYEYESLMHSGRFDFAIDPSVETVTPLQLPPGVEIGQRVGLTQLDVLKISTMYEKECGREKN